MNRICPPCRIYRFRAGIEACPKSGAAAEIPYRLLLPLAAAARNPPAPVCAEGELPRRGKRSRPGPLGHPPLGKGGFQERTLGLRESYVILQTPSTAEAVPLPHTAASRLGEARLGSLRQGGYKVRSLFPFAHNIQQNLHDLVHVFHGDVLARSVEGRAAGAEVRARQAAERQTRTVRAAADRACRGL